MSRTRLALAGCVVALAALSGCAAEDPATAPLRLGLPPGEASPEFQERFAPVEELLESSTGREVEVTTTSDYLAIVEAMRSGLLDLAVFSPFPTPIAQQVANVEPLVAGETEVYSSMIVCRTDSGITDISGVRGATVAFVDAGSTSGNYIPKLLLTRAGIDPDTEVEGTYAGGHDVALLAAAQGSVDCAANATQLYESALAEGAIEPGVLQVVAQSESIPISLIIIAREGLDEEIKRAVTDAFVNDPPQAVLDARPGLGADAAEAHMTAVELAGPRPPGLCNVRDVGGLPTVDGRVTRTGILLRSDLPLLGDPTPPTVPVWPPSTVLDLRAPVERVDEHPLAAVRPIPLFDDLMLDGAQERTWPAPDQVDAWFDALYLRCLRERAAAVAEAVTVVLTAPRPVLVHCAAGRDRTGIVVALALRAARVTRAAIVADYRRTEDNHLRLMDRLAAHGVPAAARSRRLATEVLATPGAIEAVLDEVEAHPGGVHGWLIAHGVAAADLDRWRSEAVEG